MDALDRSRQLATMGHMREVATANSLYFLDNGQYAPALTDLSPEFFENPPLRDAWGTDYRYIRWLFLSDLFWLWSYGSDGAIGPFPGAGWVSEPTEGDMIMAESVFFIAPTGQ